LALRSSTTLAYNRRDRDNQNAKADSPTLHQLTHACIPPGCEFENESGVI
jgi:hypothetical protein